MELVRFLLFSVCTFAKRLRRGREYIYAKEYSNPKSTKVNLCHHVKLCYHEHITSTQVILKYVDNNLLNSYC